jgi:hypothetical protein
MKNLRKKRLHIYEDTLVELNAKLQSPYDTDSDGEVPAMTMSCGRPARIFSRRLQPGRQGFVACCAFVAAPGLWLDGLSDLLDVW